jgi:two-component system NtrC family sensor kinase
MVDRPRGWAVTERPAIVADEGAEPSRKPAPLRAPWTVAGLFLLSVLLPATFLLASALERRAAMWEGARRDAEQTVSVLARLAQHLLETQELILELTEDLVRNEADAAIAEPHTGARLSAIADRFPQTVSIWVSNAEGGILAGSQPAPAGNTFANQEYFLAQRQNPSPRFLSRPYVGQITGRASFAMSRRRPTADGSFAGVIHVAISPDHTAETLRGATADAGGAVALLRQDGEIIARFPPLHPPRPLPPDGLLMRAIRERPGGGVIIGTSSLDGVDRVYAYRPIPPFPAFVGFGVDMHSRIAAWREAVLRDAALALIAAALLAATTWLAWRGLRARTHAAAILRHETDRRHALERQLEQARSLEALGRMARGVAHDFNNLLTVVIGNLEAIEDRAPDPSLRGLAIRARKAAEAGAGLAGSLLAFARTQMLRVEAVQLGMLLEDMRPVLQDLATRAVELRLEVAPDLPECLCDVAQFRAAIGNLVSNARDAMRDGGRIRIAVRAVELDAAAVAANPDAKPGHYVATAVSDTGSGMSPEVLARAFDPFFTTKAPGSGSGLGLSHVFGLVTQLGGIVTLSSELGEGTTITLHLPARDAPPDEAPRAPEDTATSPPMPPARQVGRPRRVLVVDDKPDIRQLAKAMLTRAGLDVTVAAGSAEAIAAMGGGDRFDLLLTDVVMSGDLDGVALAAHLRAVDPAMSILLMSGYAPDPEAIRALGASLLAKPFNRQALLSAVTSALGEAAVSEARPAPTGP